MSSTYENHHHEATDSLLRLLTKANHDLTVIQHRLDKEFQQIYPDNANPMKLVSRIKKVQEDLSALKDQCRDLLSAKQDLIDKARTVLVGNRSSLQRMQASMAFETTSDDSGDSAFDSFNQVVCDVLAPFASRQPRLMIHGQGFVCLQTIYLEMMFHGLSMSGQFKSDLPQVWRAMVQTLRMLTNYSFLL